MPAVAVAESGLSIGDGSSGCKRRPLVPLMRCLWLLTLLAGPALTASAHLCCTALPLAGSSRVLQSACDYSSELIGTSLLGRHTWALSVPYTCLVKQKSQVLSQWVKWGKSRNHRASVPGCVHYNPRPSSSLDHRRPAVVTFLV